jgi:hypothetical protein
MTAPIITDNPRLTAKIGRVWRERGTTSINGHAASTHGFTRIAAIGTLYTRCAWCATENTARLKINGQWEKHHRIICGEKHSDGICPDCLKIEKEKHKNECKANQTEKA